MFSKLKFNSDLFDYRTKNGLTRQALQNKSGVPKQTIAGLENNLYKPTIDNFIKLCKAIEQPINNYIS